MPIVFMKFSEGWSYAEITIFWVESYDCVCPATTQHKEDEQEGQEGFPGDVTQGLNVEGWLGARRVDRMSRDIPKKGIHQCKGVQANEREEYLKVL